MNLLSRRSRPRTTIGKLMQAWRTLRQAIRIARFIARARLAIQAALFTLVVVAVARILSRRRRRGTEPLASYAPAPVPHTAPRPVAPIHGDAPTETERKLQAEK